MPTSRVREVLDSPQESIPVIEAETEAPAGGLHILLADDNQYVRESIQDLLILYGCSVHTAENGHNALEKMKNGHYDLVLMDIQMPVMDGITSAREMRSWEKEQGLEETPIIALTGNAGGQDVEKCLAAGFNSIFAKPVRIEDLMKVLSDYSSVAGRI